MKIVNLRKYNQSSSLKAFFDVETSEGMVVKGFKIVQGSNGLFVGNPSEYSKKDEKYYDRVFVPKELKEKLEKLAIDEYGGGDTLDETVLPF